MNDGGGKLLPLFVFRILITNVQRWISGVSSALLTRFIYPYRINAIIIHDTDTETSNRLDDITTVTAVHYPRRIDGTAVTLKLATVYMCNLDDMRLAHN